MSDTSEFKYCTQARNSDCERQFEAYTSKLIDGYEKGQWAPVHCATAECHGVWHETLDQYRYSRGPPRCKSCDAAERSAASQPSRKRELEVHSKDLSKKEPESKPKRQRKKKVEEKGPPIYAILSSVDEKRRVVKAHFVFDCQHSWDVHDNTGFDHLIGVFCDYVKKYGKYNSFVDDVIETYNIVSSIDELVDPVFVDENTNS